MKVSQLIKNNPFTFLLFLLALVASVVTFHHSWILATIELACLLLITVFSAKWFSNDLKRKIEQISYLSKTMENRPEENEVLQVFPLPVVLIDAEGSMIWCNTLFENLLGDFS